MDKLILTLPDWVVYTIGIWFLLATIDHVLNIYIFYLTRKLEKLEQTTSSTVSVGCKICRNCGTPIEQ